MCIRDSTYCEPEIPFEERLELDKWILSELNSLIKNVDEAYEDYEPTSCLLYTSRCV